MKFRYCDRPVQMFKEILPELDGENAYTAELKMDGWNVHLVRDIDHSAVREAGIPESFGIGRDSSLFFLSRRDMKKGGPTQIPVSQAIAEYIDNANLPDKTEICCEWMARRSIGEIPETLFIFDAMWWNNEWQGDKVHWERTDLLRSSTLIITEKARNQTITGCLENGIITDPVQLVPNIETGFSEVYDKLAASKTFQFAEGLVLKRRSSTLKGGFQKGEDNGSWIKVKYRAGCSGRETFNL